MRIYRNFNWERFFKWIVFVLVVSGLLFWVAALSSCSETRKIEKAYDKVGLHEPISTKDSQIIRKRFLGIYKEPKVIVRPGKTVKVPYAVEKLKKVLDTAERRKIVDSIVAAHKDYDKYNEEDFRMALKNAADSGYAKAQYEDYINGRDSVEPEIQYYPDPSVIANLESCKSDLRQAQASVIKKTEDDNIHKSEARNRLFIIFGLIAALCFSVYRNFKKTPVSAFDKLKNIV